MFEDFFGSDTDFTVDFGSEWNIFSGGSDNQLDLASSDYDFNAAADSALNTSGNQYVGDNVNPAAEATDEMNFESEADKALRGSGNQYGGENKNQTVTSGASAKSGSNDKSPSWWDKFSKNPLAPAAVSMAGGIVGSYMKNKMQLDEEKRQRERYVNGYRSGQGLSLWSPTKRSA